MIERRQDYPKIVERLARIEERVIAMDKRVNGSIERAEKHIYEGDRVGGFRDRLTKMESIVMKSSEEKLNSTKASQWRIGIICAMPGIILAVLKVFEMLYGS